MDSQRWCPLDGVRCGFVLFSKRNASGHRLVGTGLNGSMGHRAPGWCPLECPKMASIRMLTVAPIRIPGVAHQSLGVASIRVLGVVPVRAPRVVYIRVLKVVFIRVPKVVSVAVAQGRAH